jgi:hypothetical protein
MPGKPRAVIFLGPSLQLDEAEKILGFGDEAEFRPPAKRGDIFKAAEDGAELICLIDGVFFQDCSVAHKEILYALEHEVKVIGASSMGALRASEMDVYGMEGVGEIYQAYKKGAFESDDEVALTFDPYTFTPQSEPLVNVRHSLTLAIKQGVLNQGSAEVILRAAQSLYFPDRVYDRILKAAGTKGVSSEAIDGFKSFLKAGEGDLKGKDTRKALKRAREILENG